MTTDSTPTGPFILVGVDGSAGSLDALRWAAKQAALTGVSLRVATAWQVPAAYGAPVDLGTYDPQANAGEVLQQTLAEAGVDGTTTQVVQGNAAARLVELSEGADLLVVGRRGHGEIIGTLLGSVSGYCVAHASCPVVVVHHSQKGTNDPAGK